MKNRSFDVRAELARVAVGRMFLHVACALRGGHVQWHWEGVKREFRECCGHTSRRAIKGIVRPR